MRERRTETTNDTGFGPGPGGRPGMPPGMPGGGGFRPGMMMPKARPKQAGATLRRLWDYLRAQRAALLLVVVLTALHAGIALIGPYLIAIAIDDYIMPQRYEGLLTLCLALLGLYALGAAMNWFQARSAVVLSQRTVRAMRADMFGKLQGLPLRFFDSRPDGDMMSRATNDIESVANTLNQSMTQLISSVLTVGGCLTIMLALDWRLTLLSLFTIPLVMLLTKIVAKHTRKQFAAQQKHMGELNGFIEETVSGQKAVKAYCREARAFADFGRMNDKLADAGIRAQILTGMMGPFMNLIGNLGFAVVALGGGWMAIMQWTTVGIVAAFLNYSRQLTRPVNELANQFNMIQAAIAGAERVFELMDERAEEADDEAAADAAGGRPGGSAVRGQLGGGAERGQDGSGADAGDTGDTAAGAGADIPIRGDVVFRGVTFGYKPDAPVLRDVSLHAEPGEMIALVGPTGAGKTTIVNLLTRFYETDAGEITIDGVDIRRYDRYALRRQLGIVLQDAYVFSDTIRENIRYGRLGASDADVEAAAKLANADGFIRKLPQGYDTVLAKDGSNVSHGQRQLLTIARAILADPAVLILDEATSSIDTRTEMHIQEAMRTLMKGRTSFVIAHRLGTIREADRILVIDGGRIIEQGNHEQLIAQQGFYYNLYTTQFRRTG